MNGDPDLNSPRELTEPATEQLQLANEALQKRHIVRIRPEKPVSLIILPKNSPTAILWQDRHPLEWQYLNHTPEKTITTHLMLVSQIISKGRTRKQISGYDPSEVIVPLNNSQIQQLFVESMDWQEFPLWLSG